MTIKVTTVSYHEGMDLYITVVLLMVLGTTDDVWAASDSNYQ